MDMPPEEQTELWEDRVALAFEQLEEHHPKALSAAGNSIKEFLDRCADRPDLIEQLIGSRRSDLIERLTVIADTDNPYVLSASLGVLARLGYTEGFSLATKAINSSNPYVREAGVRLFGLSAPDEELHRLGPLLNDPHRPASVAAIRAVERRQFRELLPTLLKLLQKGREDVRKCFGTRNPRRGEIASLLHAIVGFLGQEAIPLLVDIASNDVALRSYAVRLLVELNVPEAAPVLAHLLVDPSRTLREQVLRLVLRADYRPALPLARPLLLDADSRIRKMALAVVTAWRDLDSTEALEHLARYDTNPMLRLKAIKALVLFQGEAAEDVLLELTGDTNTHVRKAVVRALAQFPHKMEESWWVIRRLACDDTNEAVREAAQAALESEAGLFKASEAAPVPVVGNLLVPTELLDELPAVDEWLRHWRKSLPQHASNELLEEISRSDDALGKVLQTLADTRNLVHGDEACGETIVTS